MAILRQIDTSFQCQSNGHPDNIRFANTIVIDRSRKKGEQRLQNNIEKWNKKRSFEILNGIINIVTLVQLMYAIGNLNYSVGIVGNWIFDLNYKKHLH